MFLKRKICNYLEDDCIPENGFFSFCKEMLIKYSSDRSVAHISGCNLYYGTSKKRLLKIKIIYFQNFLILWAGLLGKIDGKNIMILNKGLASK